MDSAAMQRVNFRRAGDTVCWDGSGPDWDDMNHVVICSGEHYKGKFYLCE